MSDFWDDVTVIKLEVGDTVLCDLCNKDYTHDDKTTGGFYFSGKAVCPDCSDGTMKSIKKYHEERFIRAYADENETFRDFVYRLRRHAF